jgi:hypothetical protein
VRRVLGCGLNRGNKKSDRHIVKIAFILLNATGAESRNRAAAPTASERRIRRTSMQNSARLT